MSLSQHARLLTTAVDLLVQMIDTHRDQTSIHNQMASVNSFFKDFIVEAGANLPPAGTGEGQPNDHMIQDEDPMFFDAPDMDLDETFPFPIDLDETFPSPLDLPETFPSPLDLDLFNMDKAFLDEALSDVDLTSQAAIQADGDGRGCETLLPSSTLRPVNANTRAATRTQGAFKKYTKGWYLLAAIPKEGGGGMSLEAWRIESSVNQYREGRRFPDIISYTCFPFAQDQDIFSPIPSTSSGEYNFNTSNEKGIILTPCAPLNRDRTFKKALIGPAHHKMSPLGALHTRAFGANCKICMKK